MQFSREGIVYLSSANMEGRKNKKYKDSANKWTIGVGHLIKPNEKDLLDKTLTEEEIDSLLQKDLAEAVETVNEKVTVPLTQYEFDALVMFVFNIGVTGFTGSSVRTYLNQNNFLQATDMMLKWHHITVDGKLVDCPGLVNRRLKEIKLLKTGKYGDKGN